MELAARKKRNLIFVPSIRDCFEILDYFDLPVNDVKYTWYVVEGPNGKPRLVYPTTNYSSRFFYSHNENRALDHDREFVQKKLEDASSKIAKDAFTYMLNAYFSNDCSFSIKDVREVLWTICTSKDTNYCEASCSIMYKSFSSSNTKEEFQKPYGLSIKLSSLDVLYFFLGPEDIQIDDSSWSSPNMYLKAIEKLKELYL